MYNIFISHAWKYNSEYYNLEEMLNNAPYFTWKNYSVPQHDALDTKTDRELEEALKRIEELEKENAELREELEYYRNRKLSGRQKHNAKWMAIYNDFVVGYESGMTMVEIAKRNNVSERTIYRYKAYYDKLREKEE